MKSILNKCKKKARRWAFQFLKVWRKNKTNLSHIYKKTIDFVMVIYIINEVWVIHIFQVEI